MTREEAINKLSQCKPLILSTIKSLKVGTIVLGNIGFRRSKKDEYTLPEFIPIKIIRQCTEKEFIQSLPIEDQKIYKKLVDQVYYYEVSID